MSDRFSNSRKRVLRAAEHARSFATEWSLLLENDSFTPKIRADIRPGWYVLFVHFSPKTANRLSEDSLALEIGEFAYQLRAALDGTVWDAATYLQGFEPSADEGNRLEFPIFNGKNRDSKKCAEHDFPFPDDLKDWIASIQPYAMDKPSVDLHRGLQTILENIHNLARLDRHRRLRMVTTTPVAARTSIETFPPGGKIVEADLLGCDVFRGQEEILRFKVECAGGLTPDKVRLRTHLAFQTSVEGIEIESGQDVLAQLDIMLQGVKPNNSKI